MNGRYIKRKVDGVLIEKAERLPALEEEIVESIYDNLVLIDTESGVYRYAHQDGEPYIRSLDADADYVAWYKIHLKSELQQVIGDNLLDILNSGLSLETDIVPQWSGFLSAGASMTTVTELNAHYNSAIDFLNLSSDFYK